MWYPPDTPLEDQIPESAPSENAVFPRILLQDAIPATAAPAHFQQSPQSQKFQQPPKLVYPLVHGRPTQPALNREQQKQAFASLQAGYSFAQHTTAPPPLLQHSVLKEVAQSPEELLTGFKTRLQDYAFQTEVKAVEKTLEEKQTATTVKQFYCQHVFQPVRVQWMGLPVRYKICKTCGLVK